MRTIESIKFVYDMCWYAAAIAMWYYTIKYLIKSIRKSNNKK